MSIITIDFLNKADLQTGNPIIDKKISSLISGLGKINHNIQLQISEILNGSNSRKIYCEQLNQLLGLKDIDSKKRKNLTRTLEDIRSIFHHNYNTYLKLKATSTIDECFEIINQNLKFEDYTIKVLNLILYKSIDLIEVEKVLNNPKLQGINYNEYTLGIIVNRCKTPQECLYYISDSRFSNIKKNTFIFNTILFKCKSKADIDMVRSLGCFSSVTYDLITIQALSKWLNLNEILDLIKEGIEGGIEELDTLLEISLSKANSKKDCFDIINRDEFVDLNITADHLSYFFKHSTTYTDCLKARRHKRLLHIPHNSTSLHFLLKKVPNIEIRKNIVFNMNPQIVDTRILNDVMKLVPTYKELIELLNHPIFKNLELNIFSLSILVSKATNFDEAMYILNMKYHNTTKFDLMLLWKILRVCQTYDQCELVLNDPRFKCLTYDFTILLSLLHTITDIHQIELLLTDKRFSHIEPNIVLLGNIIRKYDDYENISKVLNISSLKTVNFNKTVLELILHSKINLQQSIEILNDSRTQNQTINTHTLNILLEKTKNIDECEKVANMVVFSNIEHNNTSLNIVLEKCNGVTQCNNILQKRRYSHIQINTHHLNIVLSKTKSYNQAINVINSPRFKGVPHDEITKQLLQK